VLSFIFFSSSGVFFDFFGFWGCFFGFFFGFFDYQMTIYVTALLLFVFGCGVLALAGSTRDRTERNR
jgi:hypothetical protein